MAGLRRLVDPISRAGTPTKRWPGVEEGDFLIEYWPGHPTYIYRAEKARGQLAPRLVKLNFSREQALTVGAIGETIGAVADDHGQHAGVVFEITNNGADVRQIGNVEVTRHGGRVIWTRAKNTRLPPGILRADPRVRYETKWKIGERGAVYQFNVKFKRGDYSADVSDENLYIETEHAVRAFADVLRDRFPWVGNVYLTGRSGGWLAVEDRQGKATKKKIGEIADMVDDARKEFGKSLDEEYGE